MRNDQVNQSTSKGNINEGAFKGHQHCQGGHFVQTHVLGKPDPALYRHPVAGVMHTVPRDDCRGAIPALDGESETKACIRGPNMIQGGS